MFFQKLNISSVLFYLFILFVLPGCNKDKTPDLKEEALQISVDAAAFAIIPGPEYDFTLNILSAIPPDGLQINVDVEGEVNGLNYFSSPIITATGKSTKLKITLLPRQVICVCKVKVTSKSNDKNYAETSFRVAVK